MKLNSTIEIDVSALKKAAGPGVSVQAIRNDLVDAGAEVSGIKDPSGRVVMVIGGDVDVEEIDAAFQEDANVDFNDFIIDEPDLLGGADGGYAFESRKRKRTVKIKLNEADEPSDDAALWNPYDEASIDSYIREVPSLSRVGRGVGFDVTVTAIDGSAAYVELSAPNVGVLFEDYYVLLSGMGIHNKADRGGNMFLVECPDDVKTAYRSFVEGNLDGNPREGRLDDDARDFAEQSLAGVETLDDVAAQIEALSDNDGTLDEKYFSKWTTRKDLAERFRASAASARKSPAKRRIDEKKKGCCPKNGGGRRLVSLAEAISGKNGAETSAPRRRAGLDQVVDDMVGKSVDESLAAKALAKARRERTGTFLRGKLGEKRYKRVVESLEAGKKSMYGSVKVNHKPIADYSTEELRGLLERVEEQLKKLEAQASGINEGDEANKLREAIENKKKVRRVLDDEISFREALAVHEDDGSDDFGGFRDLNPDSDSDSDSEKKDGDGDEEKKDGDRDGSDEKSSDSDDSNPDEDEKVELGRIVVTLKKKSSAENLKSDLVDAGVPEDAIEIEPADEDDSDEDNDENGESESGEGSSDEGGNAGSEEKAEESVRSKAGKKVNEDDGDGSDSDGKDGGSDDSDSGSDDENKDKDGGSDDSDSDDDKNYKVVLTDMDYVNDLRDVLVDGWGFTQDEFDDMIGGQIVTDDDENSSDDSGDGDGEKKDGTDDKSGDDSGSDGKDGDESSPDLDDFDPEEIFKGL